MTPEQAKQLREPFPKSAIGRMDRGNGVVLDFVGHAATTQRLLEVDPTWSWKPLAVDASGLPAFDTLGGLWIELTVCGVTRLGYGDAGGKKGPNAVKEAIGDAIRNAAMRFGVAIDLWAKEDITTTFEQPKPVATPAQIKAWTAALKKADTVDALHSAAADLTDHHIPDDALAALRDVYQARLGELS